MSKASESDVQQFKKLRGTAKAQKYKGMQNELYVLFALARFGWLTTHQVGVLIWPDKSNSNELSRKILARLYDKSCVNFSLMTGSPGGQIRAYFLKRKAMQMLLNEPKMASGIRVQSTSRSITDNRYQYHRLLCNQLLIDIRRKRIALPFSVSDNLLFMSEHEMNPVRKDINAHFGCIPDGIINNDGELLVCEIENSCRGPARHGSKLKQEGNKLQDWLPIYIDRLKREGQFSDHLLPMGSAGSYINAREVFVCSSEKVFRSIWRKMYLLLGQFNKLHNFIFYIVLDSPKWVDPLHPSNIMILEHNSPEARQLVAAGEERTRKY